MYTPNTYNTRKIWLTITVVLMALGSGHYYASDEETMFGVTLRMWQVIHHLVDARVVVERPILTPYGPMQSVLALFTLPMGALFAWLGPSEMAAWLLRLPSTWINAGTVAAIATLLGWISIQRGYSQRVAYLVALSYAFATPALKYAGSFFSEPIASWWLLVAATPVLIPTSLRTRTYVMCGMACLGAILSKIAVAPTLALIGIVVLGSTLHARNWRMLLSWGSGAFGAGVCFLTYNLLARGDLLSSGYNSRQQGYTIDWGLVSAGIHGQFLSSGKSIFLYAPVLLLLPIGLWQLRTHPRVLITIGAVVATIVLVHTNVVFWHGDGAWGPRYVMLCLPFMVVPLADAYTWVTAQHIRLRTFLVVGLVSMTAWVQIAALSINFNAYIINSRNEAERYYTPSASPILAQWRMLITQLQHDLATWQRPGVTLAGWTYSEGDRERGAQFPRFASSHAQVVVTPRGNDWPMLAATYHTCFDASGQHPVTLTLNAHQLTTQVVCPPRAAHVLLPRTISSTLTWSGNGVSMGEFPQHDWYAQLTAAVISVTVYDTTHGTYPINAHLTPPSRMPSGANAMRIWASDIRTEFYDFWWYYLMCIPATSSALPVTLLITLVMLGMAVLAWRTPTNSPPPPPSPATPTLPSTPPTALPHISSK